MRSLLLAAATLGLVFTAAAPAHAWTDENVSERISYADLNLDDSADAKIMLRRIDRAANRVCRGAVYMNHQSTARACVVETRASVIAALNKPMLTAEMQAKYGAAPLMAANETVTTLR